MPQPERFRCYLVEQDMDKKISARIAELPISQLPDGEVLIRVAYSSLNYKDALGATGHPGVVRRFPHVPGIDAAGTVLESRAPEFSAGDNVLVTGFQLGAPAWGGFSELIRVPAAWVVPLPPGLSPRESMIFGTAGFTAALSIQALREGHIEPTHGEIVVTGATGGVGSMAVAMLARLGYPVAAVSGKATARDYLTRLGASSIRDREAVHDASNKPLLNARWAGAVDVVGGNTLATIIRSTKRAGCVTACGLVGGAELHLTVHPFILRGVRLIGIDSAEYPIDRRAALWRNMAGPWRPADLEMLVAETVDLDHLEPHIQEILAGKVQGRILVKLAGD
jgi:putative YhdH/YhfP family quinone oxidoreductase